MRTKLWGWCASLAILAGAAAPAHADAHFNGPMAPFTFNCGFIGLQLRDVDGNLVGSMLTDRRPIWPAWSPDGTRIAYIDGGLRVADADGTHDHLVGTLLDSDIYQAPTWSPDGSLLALAVWPSALVPARIDLFRADTFAPPTTLVPPSHYAWTDSTWSPDGEWIAAEGRDLSSGLGPRGLVLFKITYPSGVPQAGAPLFAPFSGPFDGPPAWSRQSDALVFIHFQGTGADLFRVEVLPSGFSSTAPQQLTSVGFLDNYSRPAVSPDGALIATGNLIVMNADGSNLHTVYSDDCSALDVAWQSINTPTGTAVTVSPEDRTTHTTPVSVTFDHVTTGGNTTLVTGTGGPAPPPNFDLEGVYYDISTTTVFTGPIEVCFDTTGLNLPASPRLFHYATGLGWEDVTVSYDPRIHRLCGTTTSLSPFAILVPRSVPVISAPAFVAAEATGPAGAVVTFAVTVSDPGDPNPTLTCAPPSGSVFALGTTTVTCTARNAHGGEATASFPVTVSDTTPPTLSVPGPITVTATSGAGAVVTYTASASDLVDGTVTPTCAPPSGETFPPGTTTVTCNAQDAAGNAAAPGTFTVTVNPLPPADPLANLVALVNQLVPGNNGRALLAILDDVRRDLARGHTREACRDLVAFALRVIDLRRHHELSAARAAQLLDGARDVARAIGCGDGCP